MKNNNNNPIKLFLSNFSKNQTEFFVKKECLPRGTFPLHYHNFYEIELVLQGKGYQYINGERYEIRPGLFYLLRPTDLHELTFEEDFYVMSISFSHALLSTFFSKILSISNAPFIFSLNEKDFSYLSIIFEKLLECYSNSSPYIDILMQNLLSLILIYIIENKQIQVDYSETDEDAVSKALVYISLHFTQNPSLNDVANIAYLNPSYLSTAIKKRTGKRYSEYLNDLKVSYAKKLIRINQSKLTDIAMSSGFESICSFNRVFKKRTGLTPSQYKNKHKK